MRPVDADALFKAFEKAAWYNNADRDEIAEEILLQMPTIEQLTWVSVDERLPNHGDIVLCNTLFYVEVLQWDAIAEVWISKTSVHRKEYADYWMPLPQLPKGVE